MTDSMGSFNPHIFHRPEGTVYSSPGQTTKECRPGFTVTNKKIVRAITIIREKFLFRTKEKIFYFQINSIFQFRPKEISCFVQRIRTDGFFLVFFTQGGVSVRSFRNSALG
jgi:hypothetical protein